MSVALLSPTQYELAYKDPDYSTNKTESTKDPKMHLRGEVFLAAGNFQIIKFFFEYVKIRNFTFYAPSPEGGRIRFHSFCSPKAKIIHNT